MQPIEITKRRNLAELLSMHLIEQTQVTLAQAIGIKVGTLNTYLRGESFPNPMNQKKIADYLKVNLEDFEEMLLNPGLKLDGASSSQWSKVVTAEELYPVVLSLPVQERLKLAKHLLVSAV